MKKDLAIFGIFLAMMLGFLIGALIEHPVGPGGYQAIGALLGGLVAVTILVLGEALKEEGKPS